MPISDMDRLYKECLRSRGKLDAKNLSDTAQSLGLRKRVSEGSLVRLQAAHEFWQSLDEATKRRVHALLVFGSTADGTAGKGKKIEHREVFRKGEYKGSYFFKVPRTSDIDVKLFLDDPLISYASSHDNEEKKRNSVLFRNAVLPAARNIEKRFGVKFSFILMHPNDMPNLLADKKKFQFWRRYYLFKPFVVLHNRPFVNKLRTIARSHRQLVDEEAWFDREGKRELLAADKMRQLGTNKVFISAEEMETWRSQVYSRKPPQIMIPLKPDKFKQR